jgi:SAM-dependent methyltransferase
MNFSTNDISPDERFLRTIRDALADQSFVKLTLGKYRGGGDLKKIAIDRVTIKQVEKLRFVSHFAKHDVTANFPFDEAVNKIAALLGSDFRSGHLFTSQADTSLVYNKRLEAKLHVAPPTFSSPISSPHNRRKKHLVSPRSEYLQFLGISDAAGVVKPTMSAKFKQICRYIEILDSLLSEAGLCESNPLAGTSPGRILDIGSGKGYLTFALYDHLRQQTGLDWEVTGVEVRKPLVDFCNQVAEQLRYSNLRFEQVEANHLKLDRADVIIALHACDTATDDAIHRGIMSAARVIVCAPCCQHQLAPQLTSQTNSLQGILRFGLLKQRQADLVTDAARGLLMEAAGYRVKIIEFIATEHTSKNLMIAGVKSETVDRQRAREQYLALKALFGFQEHALER